MFRDSDSRLHRKLMSIPGGKPVRFSKGETIFNQGSKANALIVVSQACLTVHYITASGRKYTISRNKDFLGVLGEIEIFPTGERHIFTVIAAGPITGYQLSRERVIDAVNSTPGLALLIS